MLCFSLPLVLSGMMIGPMNWLADSIFAQSRGGLAELGVYFAALQINLMIQTINFTLGQVLFPYCVENIAKGSKAFEAVNILLPWAIGLAVTLPVLIFPELLNLIWGDKFSRDSLRIVGVFECVTAIIIASKQGIARDVIAKHRVWLSFSSSLVWGVTLIVFAFLLQDLGAIGRSSAAVSAYLVNTVIFIPIFIMQGVCNRKLVACFPAMAIWSLIGLIVFLQLQYDVSAPVRLLILLASASFIALAFKTIYKNFTIEKPA
jgi:O-antigen/teichoic acid export membrane protein